MKRTPLKRKTPMRKKSRTDSAKAKDKLWELCKQIIRLRYGNTCYTCNATSLSGSTWHTGHYITDSVCSTELSYDLRNLRPQCYRCNMNLSGNWPAFEARLIKDHGRAYVTELKKRNQLTKGRKYDILWFNRKITAYQLILDALQRQCEKSAVPTVTR